MGTDMGTALVPANTQTGLRRRYGVIETVDDLSRFVVGWSVFFPALLSVVVLAFLMNPQRFLPYTNFMMKLGLGLLGMRLKVVNGHKVDPSRGYLVYCNHVSFLDPFIAQAVLSRYSVAIEKKENFKIPVYNWFLYAWGNIPIDRANLSSAKESYRLARERLGSGVNIGVMPEGTRTRNGQLGPFKKGPFHMAIETQGQILPLAMKGLWDCTNPNLGWRIKRGTVEMIFGDPIDCAGLTKDDVEELSHRVRSSLLTALDQQDEQALAAR